MAFLFFFIISFYHLMDGSYYHYIQTNRYYPQSYERIYYRAAFAGNQAGGERRRKNQSGKKPGAFQHEGGLQKRRRENGIYSHFFFKSELKKTAKEKFPEKMERQGDQQFKKKKVPIIFDDARSHGQLASQSGLGYDQIIYQNKND